jgi:cytochrome c oxidase subunit 4
MAENVTHAPSHAAAHQRPNYMAIFWWLLGLTIAELIVAVIPIGPAYPQLAKALLLVGMALSKALLVAMYFMHLRFEKRTLGVIAATPLIICVFLLFMLLPDLLWLWREI